MCLLLFAGRYVVESNQVDVLSLSMLRDFQEVEHAKETRGECKLRCDVRETDLLDRIHLDLTFVHAIPRARLDVRAQPYAHATSDVAAANPVAQPLGEGHNRDGTPGAALPGDKGTDSSQASGRAID